MVRSLDGGGRRVSTRRRIERAAEGEAARHAAFSTAIAGTLEDAAIVGRGTKYPEWDVHRRCYRPDWCTVHEVEPRSENSTPLRVSDAHALRRSLARLGMGLDSCHRQVQGDDIDIDAAVEARVELMAGSAPDEAVYVDSLRRRRDLSVLLLLDISGSVAEPGATAQDRARATAGGGRRAHGRSSRSRRSRGALRLSLAGAIRRAPGAGEALRRRPRRARDAASSRLSCRAPTRDWARRSAMARPCWSSGAGRRAGCSSCCPTGWRTTTATNACTERPTRGARSPRPAAGVPPASV